MLAQIAAIMGGLLVFLFLLTFSIAPYFASLPRKGATEAQFKAELDREAPRMLRHFGIPGVVIATVVNGAPSRIYAYGFANLERRQPMTPDTVFRVASISKSLTAWGVLRLVQDGKVSLDGSAQSYLRQWPLAPSVFPSKAITVRRLLNHSEGLNPGTDTFRSANEPAQSPLDVLREGGAAGAPASQIQPAGKSFLYSVPGYTILQMMVEDQTHEPFADYMKRTVLRPLGMNSSSFQWDETLRGRTATPYVTDHGASQIDIPQDAAADSLFTTAPDLARFIAAPLPDARLPAGAGVLSEASVAELYSDPDDASSLPLAAFGPDHPTLGYFLERLPGQPVIVTNGGYDPGWASRFYLVPATGDGIAILTNSDHAQPLIAQIASIWSSWRGLPPTGMARTYRALGVEAGAALGLVVMLTISFAGGLALEIAGQTRRFLAFRRIAPAASALECVLAITTVGLWVLAYRAVRAMPTLDAVGTSAIAFFTLVVVARVIFPGGPARQESRGPHQSSSNRKVGFEKLRRAWPA
jgi:CubicO group peptidase (beta-lactamase class C family)